MVGDRIHLELVRFLAAVRDDPQHDVRIAIDRMLVQFADDLRANPSTRERVERAKVDMYNHPDVQRSVGRIWETAQRVVLEAADDPSSELRIRASGALAQLGQTLATDPDLQARLDGWITDTVVGLVCGLQGRAHQRHHRHGGALGRARRRPSGSSWRWAATCSSSGSTGPSSAPWPGWRSTPSPSWPDARGERRGIGKMNDR